MKGLANYKITTKRRLKSIAESKKVDEVLLKHYTFILEHFDEMVAKHDQEIFKIEEEKAELFKQFVEAPQLLKELAQHLDELTKTKKNVTGQDSKVKKFKDLRERLEKLTAEMKDEGIDINEVESKIEEATKEDERIAAEAKIAEDERVAKIEAEKIADGTMAQ